MALRAATLDPDIDLDLDLSLDPPERIHHPVMVQGWHDLSFVHWPCAPDEIQRRLPPGILVDTFDGDAWVGLIPFRLSVRLPGVPPIPWICRTPEANVRTYVRGPDGRRGIWFFSLEAARLVPVLAARGWYHLPYKWARMRMWRDGAELHYESRRRWPSRGPEVRLVVEPSRAQDARPLTALERFLVCRWRLYSPTPEGVAVTAVDHPPWPLRPATLRGLQGNLISAAGLPEAREKPLVHVSTGVTVRFGRRLSLDIRCPSPG
jgi:uncharacterized protein